MNAHATEIEGTAVPLDEHGDPKLSVPHRTLVRNRIQADPLWPVMRRLFGIDASGLGTENCIKLCTALALDPVAIIQGNFTVKLDFSSHQTSDVSDLIAAFQTVSALLASNDKTFGEAVIATITDRQGGRATQKQFDKLNGLVERGRMSQSSLDADKDRAKAQADRAREKEMERERDRAASAAAERLAREEADRAREADGAKADAKPQATPPKAETAAPQADAAGAALAAMVGPHLLPSIMPTIERMVEARLEGVSTVRIEVKRHDGSEFKTDGMAHPKLATLIRACSARQVNGRVPGVWLHGPASAGKTHAAEQVAQALGLAFYSHGAMSMSHELLGFVDAGGTYHRTPFRDAFEHGGVCLMDELDSWDPAVTLALNGGLANGQLAFPDGMVKRHIDCIIIGGANTTGHGATAAYVGRNRMDGAFLSRFPIKIEWPLDVALEQAISGNVEFTKRVQAARIRAEAAGVKTMIDARHSAAGAALIAAGMTSDEAASLTYLAGLSKDQVRMVEGR